MEAENKYLQDLPRGVREESLKEALRLKRKEQEMESIQDKRLLYTELVLLKSTLIIGYWTVEQQVNLVELLLKVLTNSKKNILHYKEDIVLVEHEQKEFNLFKEESRRPTPSVDLIINCKALVCELIEIIFDFSQNDLVTQCVSIYKEMSKGMIHEMKGHRVILDENLDVVRKGEEVGLDLYNVAEWKRRLANIFGPPQEGMKQDE